MQFIGIGPLEFLLIVVIAIVVLGPKGMVSTARAAGRWIRKVTRSPLWREMMNASREIRDLPNRIAREAGIEEDLEELRRTTRGSLSEIDRTIYPEYRPPIRPAPPEDRSEQTPSGEDEM